MEKVTPPTPFGDDVEQNTHAHTGERHFQTGRPKSGILYDEVIQYTAKQWVLVLLTTKITIY